jgi:betaine-aldehyde dehydrogenase
VRSDFSIWASTSIWTHDLDRAHRFAARVQAEYIWVNGASTHYVGAPFGGYKQSGMGREESIDELLACTQIKNVNVSLRRSQLTGEHMTVCAGGLP